MSGFFTNGVFQFAGNCTAALPRSTIMREIELHVYLRVGRSDGFKLISLYFKRLPRASSSSFYADFPTHFANQLN
jgi:hypothetical protein